MHGQGASCCLLFPLSDHPSSPAARSLHSIHFLFWLRRVRRRLAFTLVFAARVAVAIGRRRTSLSQPICKSRRLSHRASPLLELSLMPLIFFFSERRLKVTKTPHSRRFQKVRQHSCIDIFQSIVASALIVRVMPSWAFRRKFMVAT
jgi:hypothetical protein